MDRIGRAYVIMSFTLSKLEDLRIIGHMADGDGYKQSGMVDSGG